jgi:diguanylate cyclase (GGDEF)-like protein
MVAMIRDWIVKQLMFGEFSSYRDVSRKSVWVGLKVSLVAYCLNLALHALLYASGLIPYDKMGDALILATVLTPPVAFTISVGAYISVGFAIHDLGVSRDELEMLSRTDMLSGLANRRAFQAAFETGNGDKIMAVFDIDRFKAVNDACGHSAGDKVIVEVAGILSKVFGERCLCARIGGEEFAVFSGELPFAEFVALSELARMRIAGMRIEMDDVFLEVTVSAGIARGLAKETFSQTFSRADKLLYRAKTSGRNKVLFSYKPGAGAESTVQARSA